MLWYRVNEAGIAAVARLSFVAQRLRYSGGIRRCAAVLLAAGSAGVAPQAAAQSFPAVFELRNLLPLAGGDGTEGFVLKGINAHDGSGGSASAAADMGAGVVFGAVA